MFKRKIIFNENSKSFTFSLITFNYILFFKNYMNYLFSSSYFPFSKGWFISDPFSHIIFIVLYSSLGSEFQKQNEKTS